MKGKCIMLQGTASSVGKSLLTAAVCRILKQDGYRVAPFKSQNMSLNSYITADGCEMGRAQVVQAEACGILPTVEMNPILLKPSTDRKAQVIFNGKVHDNMSAAQYHEFKPRLKEMLREIYQSLEDKYDYVVLEGAGSPAEINLRDQDVVNMGMAELAGAPVVLIGDIDKGGVFASLAGTMLLLQEEERKRVKGVIINKFRGDVEILKPGLQMLEDIIHIPVIGVIPYMDIDIEDEDSVTERFHNKSDRGREISIGVLKLPHISNFTDFNALAKEPDVDVRYIMNNQDFGDPDILIIPGTKNTIEDLLYLRSSGLEARIQQLYSRGKTIIGICGGFQMLGRELHDPLHTESNIPHMEGMGLLDMETTFAREKVTTQVEAEVLEASAGVLKGMGGTLVEGYEIHMGITRYGSGIQPAVRIRKRLGRDAEVLDGVANHQGNVWGSYIHGIFDNSGFLRGLINNIRQQKGLDGIEASPMSFKEFKEREYDRLAGMVRSHLDMERLYAILRGEL